MVNFLSTYHLSRYKHSIIPFLLLIPKVKTCDVVKYYLLSSRLFLSGRSYCFSLLHILVFLSPFNGGILAACLWPLLLRFLVIISTVWGHCFRTFFVLFCHFISPMVPHISQTKCLWPQMFPGLGDSHVTPEHCLYLSQLPSLWSKVWYHIHFPCKSGLALLLFKLHFSLAFFLFFSITFSILSTFFFTGVTWLLPS